MIKKLFYVLIMFVMAATAKGQQTIDELCQGASEDIYKSLRKANIAEQSKIVILYFEGQTGTGYAVKTPLGMHISNKLATILIKKLSKKEYYILFPENTQEKKYFSVPNTAEEQNKFYEKLNENQNPDYFITGKYYISSDFTTISLTEMVLKENKYKTGNAGKTIAFDSYRTIIQPQDAEELKHLNIEFSEEDDFMNKILQFSENNEDLFDAWLINLENKREVREYSTVFIGKSYTIIVEVKTPCFLYAFFYMPEDKLNPYLQPLYPYEIKTDKDSEEMFKIGMYQIPHPAGFVLEPTKGNMYIKIIATLKPMPFKFSSKEIYTQGNKRPSYLTSISNSDAEIFYTGLKTEQKQKSKLRSQLMIYTVE